MSGGTRERLTRYIDVGYKQDVSSMDAATKALKRSRQRASERWELNFKRQLELVEKDLKGEGLVVCAFADPEETVHAQVIWNGWSAAPELRRRASSADPLEWLADAGVMPSESSRLMYISTIGTSDDERFRSGTFREDLKANFGPVGSRIPVIARFEALYEVCERHVPKPEVIKDYRPSFEGGKPLEGYAITEIIRTEDGLRTIDGDSFDLHYKQIAASGQSPVIVGQVSRYQIIHPNVLGHLGVPALPPHPTNDYY